MERRGWWVLRPQQCPAAPGDCSLHCCWFSSVSSLQDKRCPLLLLPVGGSRLSWIHWLILNSQPKGFSQPVPPVGAAGPAAGILLCRGCGCPPAQGWLRSSQSTASEEGSFTPRCPSGLNHSHAVFHTDKPWCLSQLILHWISLRFGSEFK